MRQLTSDLVLYHGSYCIVENPDLQKCAFYKDFGQGFYLTTDREQAQKFAKITASKRLRQGLKSEKCGYLSLFKIIDLEGLKTFVFETADVDWLHCVVAHRRQNSPFVAMRQQLEKYDVLGGKIANDDTNATIMAYMGNVFGPMGTEAAYKICIGLLLPERLKDQYCFRTAKALSKLQFLKSEKVPLEL